MTANTGPTLRVAGDPGGEVLAAARDAATATRVIETGSTGHPGLEPLAMATRDGRTAFHAAPAPDRAGDLVTDLDSGTLPAEGAHAIVEHEPGPGALPVPDEGPLSVGRRRALARCGWVRPAELDDYGGSGGLVSPGLEAGIETVGDVGVLGRGRGDAAADSPVAEEWATARDAEGEPVVVVNAHAGDPAVAGDALLIDSAPVEVLDGALAAAAAVGATEIVVYAPGELERERAREAAAALGEVDAPASIEVVAGPEDYRAGEPTMALEALEGADRIEARRRPPGPATYGLFGRPTLVHTPRTLAQVRAALADPGGLDPGAADPGTRLVTLDGDVPAPATVELPTDATLRRALPAADREEFKLACVGGRFGGVTRTLDVPASAPALSAARLGTDGAIELFGEGRCAVALAGTRARFAREENCGRCVPCREGSVQLHELCRAVYDGDYRDDDIRELARTMRETSVCGFGRGASRPVTTAMEAFETEFRAHAEGRCPAGECEGGA